MKPTTVVLCLFFGAFAVAVPLPDTPIPPNFSNMEHATITDMMEKHTLPDVIRLMFQIDSERFSDTLDSQHKANVESFPEENVLVILSSFTPANAKETSLAGDKLNKQLYSSEFENLFASLSKAILANVGFTIPAGIEGMKREPPLSVQNALPQSGKSSKASTLWIPKVRS